MIEKKKIPKVIHYFWFGHNPESELMKKCIQSWKKYCPDFEIKRWDESNYDVNSCNYIKEAYEAKKWAFVSDYARFDILSKYGGIYLDTDVELLKSLNSIVEKGQFFALENELYDSVAPGLGMAAFPNDNLIIKILADYKKSHFILKNGLYDETPVGKRLVDRFLLKDGLKDVKGIQEIDDFKIYPCDYFCPYNFSTRKLNITTNTVAIHHYASSWWTKQDKRYWKIGQFFAPIVGIKNADKLQRIIKLPYSLKKKSRLIGFRQALLFYINKYFKK